MAEDSTEPVNGEIMPRFTDAQLPIVALIFDAIEHAEARRSVEAIGSFALALRSDPMWAMGMAVGFMRTCVTNLAIARGVSFAEAMALVRHRAAN
jgi:hypothetical protein